MEARVADRRKTRRTAGGGESTSGRGGVPGFGAAEDDGERQIGDGEQQIEVVSGSEARRRRVGVLGFEKERKVSG